MKKGYWVVAYKSLLVESAVEAYGALALPAVESFCGRLLTRSTSQAVARSWTAAADDPCGVRQL